MAIQNSNLVIEIRCQANLVEQGCENVAGVLGRAMPEALSQHGRPMSPGLAEFTPTKPRTTNYRGHGNRIGRSASLPGNPVRSRFWQLPTPWATPTRTGITASSPSVHRRGLSVLHERHQQTNDHDYQSSDRRDDRNDVRTGLALNSNGK